MEPLKEYCPEEVVEERNVQEKAGRHLFSKLGACLWPLEVQGPPHREWRIRAPFTRGAVEAEPRGEEQRPAGQQ